VNGNKAEVVHDIWKVKVAIKTGVNTLTIVAVDQAGNSNTVAEKVDVYERTTIIMTIDSQDWTKNSEAMEALEVPAMIIAGRTMVPLRAIVEDGLGVEPDWDPITKSITITIGDDQISMVINDPIAYVNAVPVELDAPPTIIGGRTLVPVRFIAESFGFEVFWVAATRTVTLVRDILPS
jgi:hypothetical protein